MFFVPETYAPVLLSKRAKFLSSSENLKYTTPRDIHMADVTFKVLVEESLVRPLRILILEPIVLLLSIYMALIYGCLYLFFEAIPLVFMIARGWNPLISALPFISLGVGFLIGLGVVGISQRLYLRAIDPKTGRAPPEARLHACMWAAIAFPVSFFWFAWTCYPVWIPWPASVVSLSFFGFGMVGLFLSGLNYVIDYVSPPFAASAVAGNAFLRSLLGAVFPLFAEYMYAALGLNWASSLLGFVTVVLAPIPFLFFRFGHKIRAHSQFAHKHEADLIAEDSFDESAGVQLKSN